MWLTHATVFTRLCRNTMATMMRALTVTALPVVQTTRRTVRRCTVVTRAGKCACGKTSDAAGNCDGSHAKKMCGMSRGRYYMLWRMHRCGWHLSRSSDSHLLRRLRQDCQPQGLLRRQPR